MYKLAATWVQWIYQEKKSNFLTERIESADDILSTRTCEKNVGGKGRVNAKEIIEGDRARRTAHIDTEMLQWN